MATTKLKGKQVEQFTSTTEGVVPQSGGGTINFLRADGTWAIPSGGGGTIITSGTSIPTGGSDGDIYLQYT